MDYKATLNLPKTSFAMKGNLPQTEPKMLERWEAEKLYAQVLAHREGSPSFILHDGPPYANGDIHIGHALNKILKDFIVRSKTMRGFQSPYVPGWDCHGLPIEYALMKELKVNKHQVDIADFRRKARVYATKYVGIQRDQFKRLGIQGDWGNPYLTLEPGYVTAALRVLSTLVGKGFIYRARKPVNWCWSCETALAEAEVEYEAHTSPSVYVKFPLTEETARKNGRIEPGARRGTYLVIWTTTPWTLMGNVAVAVHPNLEYAVRNVGQNEEWITLVNLPEGTRQALGSDVDPRNVKQTIIGKDLEGWKYYHPFGLPGERKVVLADYVSHEDGTGLVHTAPGFGAEDFATGRKYGLEPLAPVDSQGKFVGLPKEAAQFNGQQVQAANPAVVELLRSSGHLVAEKEIEHEYPHCWRCHNPIIFRATDQWFLKIEHDDLRRKLLEAVEKQVTWIPPEGKERMAGMIKTRPDWCLSRQRLWGIPIPAVVCTKCGEGVLDQRVIENFATAIEGDPEGSDKWFTEMVTKWLPAGFTCAGCGGTAFQRGTDILDVWFDSGVSHKGVLARREKLRAPADMYLEGSDQHRGWFQVSLIIGVALEGKAPYKSVLTHGFVVDGDGRKMSKSLGNVIAPQEVVSTVGADVLRLWVAASDYREDVRLSKEILAQAAEMYRKIRNTIRFCLANVADFNAAESAVPIAQMEELDRWALSQLNALVEEVTHAYDQCSFHRVVKTIHEFCTIQLSNFYLDVVKDRLYTSPAKSPQRRSTQTALAQIADAFIRMMAPILPVTAEEAWGALYPGQISSVHCADWPDPACFPRDRVLEERWRRLLDLRDEAMKELEKARQAQVIGDSIEAELELTVGDAKLLEFLKPYRETLAAACIVSGLRLMPAEGPGAAPVAVSVRKAPGAKCQRCWMRLPTVGQSAEHPTLCGRCVEAVRG